MIASLVLAASWVHFSYTQFVAHKLSEREHRRIERMARKGELHRLFAYFAEFRGALQITKPLLIGSMDFEDVLVEGYQPASNILAHFCFLDPVYNTATIYQKTFGKKKRGSNEKAILKPIVEGTIHRTFAKSFPRKCFLSTISSCSGRIIKAHTIQEAQLRVHARNGKVYFASSLGKRNQGLTDFKLLGVNRATTFTGFCSKHDDDIFNPIEKHPFEGTPEQVFLYHYRALCKDYYIRLVSRLFIKNSIHNFEKEGLGDQLNHARFRLEMNQSDLNEIELGKPYFDQCIKSRSFDKLSGCWMRGNGIPGLLVATNLFPLRDFLGRTFPKRGSQKLNNWISLTITVENNQPLVIIAGLKSSPLLSQLLDSIRKVPQNDLPAVLTRYSLAYSENNVLIPQWWDALTPGAQHAARLISNVQFFTDYFKGPFNWEIQSPVFF